jgi:hypothetical protein
VHGVGVSCFFRPSEGASGGLPCLQLRPDSLTGPPAQGYQPTVTTKQKTLAVEEHENTRRRQPSPPSPRIFFARWRWICRPSHSYCRRRWTLSSTNRVCYEAFPHRSIIANWVSAAEVALKHEETKPGFSLLLLNIVASEALPLNTRLSGALCFKNFIKFNWVVS